MPEQHRVATLDELPVGGRKIVQLPGRSIGLFNVHGTIVAVLNVCPHELAPVCLGPLTGTTAATSPGAELRYEREGQILRCPWHGWEFDLLTGQCLADPRKLKRFPVSVRDGAVYVDA